MSAGLWDYSSSAASGKPPVYGTVQSYALAAAYLDGHCDTVADWGCGAAGARPYFKKSKYIGVDGSPGYADVVADLRAYHGKTAGILLRHVLEHNYDWVQVLQNALGAATHRVAIVLFLEPQPWTKLLCLSGTGGDIPNLHISSTVLQAALSGWQVTATVLARSDTSPHKHEWLYCAARA